MVVGPLIVATILTMLFAWLLTKSITQPIVAALSADEEIAEGDLTNTIKADGTDKAGRLLGAMLKMQSKLRDTLQRISGSATQLASAAEKLRAVTDESARGLSQQNNEIEQAATAVNQMTRVVEEVARNAVSMSEASKNATTSASDGRDLVQETVSAIERLSGDVQSTSTLIGNLADESRDIGKVLDVIRGLADQTNLLRSTPPSKQLVPAKQVGALRWSPTRCARWPIAPAIDQRNRTHDRQHSGGTEQAVNSMRSSTERVESTLNIAKGAGLALTPLTSRWWK